MRLLFLHICQLASITSCQCLWYHMKLLGISELALLHAVHMYDFLARKHFTPWQHDRSL